MTQECPYVLGGLDICTDNSVVSSRFTADAEGLLVRKPKNEQGGRAMTDEEQSEELRESNDSQLETQDEPPPQSRMDVVRQRATTVKDQALVAKERALTSAREQIEDSIESGRAERVGHSTIDALAKGATMGVPLLPLPLGTRRAGRAIGKHLIGRLQEVGHDRVSANLTAAEDSAPVPPQPERLTDGQPAVHHPSDAQGSALQEEAAPPPSPLIASLPAGWHPDPWGESMQRYHDGLQWTGHTAPR